MNVREQVDNLQVEIDKKRQEIRSDSYSMSVSELISLTNDSELISISSSLNQTKII
jgi:hypothetical protein